MNSEGHASLSGLAGAGTGVLAGAAPHWVAVCAAAGAISGLGPDIDSHNSTATRSLGPVTKRIHKIVAGMSGWVYDQTATRDDTAWAGGRHRGLTHTAVATVAVAIAAMAALSAAGFTAEHARLVAFAVGAGWGAHLLGDALTKHGAPVLWPIPVQGERWYGVAVPERVAITGGGVAEKIIAAACTLGIVALLGMSCLDLVVDFLPTIALLEGIT